MCLQMRLICVSFLHVFHVFFVHCAHVFLMLSDHFLIFVRRSSYHFSPVFWMFSYVLQLTPMESSDIEWINIRGYSWLPLVSMASTGVHGCSWHSRSFVKGTDIHGIHGSQGNPQNPWKSMDRVVSAWRQEIRPFPTFENYRFTKLWKQMYIEVLTCSPMRCINCRCVPGNHPVCSELNHFVWPQTNRWRVSKSYDTRHAIFSWLGATLYDLMQSSWE